MPAAKPVGRAGADVDEPPHSRNPRQFQHVGQPPDVDADDVAAPFDLQVVLVHGVGGGVYDLVDAVAVRQPGHGLPVAYIALDKGDAVFPLRDELPYQVVGRGQVIADHLMPGPRQFPDDVRSDESSAPGYQSCHFRALSVSFESRGNCSTSRVEHPEAPAVCPGQSRLNFGSSVSCHYRAAKD